MLRLHGLLSLFLRGKIKYFTVPPKNADRPIHLSAEVVKQMADEFDIASLSQIEDADIANVESRHHFCTGFC